MQGYLRKSAVMVKSFPVPSSSCVFFVYTDLPSHADPDHVFPDRDFFIPNTLFAACASSLFP